jgi:hypothetical protein
MRYVVALALTPLLVACAGHAPLTPIASFAGGEESLVANASSAARVATLPLDDPDGGRICKTVKRPGSNIADTVCHTRQQQLARQAASKEAIDELRDEQHWRDQAIQEAMMKNRYPSAVGILH